MRQTRAGKGVGALVRYSFFGVGGKLENGQEARDLVGLTRFGCGEIPKRTTPALSLLWLFKSVGVVYESCHLQRLRLVVILRTTVCNRRASVLSDLVGGSEFACGHTEPTHTPQKVSWFDVALRCSHSVSHDDSVHLIVTLMTLGTGAWSWCFIVNASLHSPHLRVCYPVRSLVLCHTFCRRMSPTDIGTSLAWGC